jgi:hypothetical protein
MIEMTERQSRAVAQRLRELQPAQASELRTMFGLGRMDPMEVFPDIRDQIIDMPPPPAAVQEAPAEFIQDGWMGREIEKRHRQLEGPMDGWDPRGRGGTWADMLPGREMQTEDIHFDGMSLVDIAGVAYEAGWRGQDLIDAVAVQIAENRNQDPFAVGDEGIVDENFGPSMGLWQLRTLVKPWQAGQPEYDKLRNLSTTNNGEMLFDPQYNANAAYAIWSSQGWQPWSVTHEDVIGTDNDYRLYLDTAEDAVKDLMTVVRSGRSR